MSWSGRRARRAVTVSAGRTAGPGGGGGGGAAPGGTGAWGGADDGHGGGSPYRPDAPPVLAAEVVTGRPRSDECTCAGLSAGAGALATLRGVAARCRTDGPGGCGRGRGGPIGPAGAPGGRAPWRPSEGLRRDAGLTALVVACGIGTYLLARTALVDDAYITLSYARNVALTGTWGVLSAVPSNTGTPPRGALVCAASPPLSHARNVALAGTWGLLSDVPSNTATAPAWVLLLAATTLVVRDPVVALGILYVLMLVTAVFALRTTARRTGLPSWAAPVGVLLIAVNPLVLSTMGLETQLLITLFTCLLAAGTAHRPALFGMVAGLIFLTRMDAVMALVLFTLFFPAALRRLHVVVSAALLVVVPWLWWSWRHLGSVVPDTLLIKSGQQSWGPYDVTNGWGWWLDFYNPLVVFTAWVPMAAGAIAVLGLVVVAVRSMGPSVLPWLGMAVAGATHWGTLAIIGVPPYHWYYGLVIAAGTPAVVALCGARAGAGRGGARRGG